MCCIGGLDAWDCVLWVLGNSLRIAHNTLPRVMSTERHLLPNCWVLFCSLTKERAHQLFSLPLPAWVCVSKTTLLAFDRGPS